jgi:hypothetical protein
MKCDIFKKCYPWLVAVLVLVAIATLRQVEDINFQYGIMPATDDEVTQWLADRFDREVVEISRQQGGFHVHCSTPLWVAVRHGGFPMGEFMKACERAGYKDFGGFTGSSQMRW